MSEVMKGRFETSFSNMMKILQWGTAPFDTERYDQLYLNLAEDEIRTVANASQSVIAYNTLRKPYVEDIELHEEVDSEAGLECIIDVPQTEQYVNFVGGDRVAIEFYGIPGERGCRRTTIVGNLAATIYQPSSDNDYNSKALKVVKKFDGDNKWVKSDGSNLATSFNTHTNQFEKIVEAEEFESLALTTYPVVVKDNEFRLDATDDDDRNSISGALKADNIEGPDVENHYTRAFDELFSNIDGRIDVMTEQDAIITIVRQSNDDALTLRYVVYPAA